MLLHIDQRMPVQKQTSWQLCADNAQFLVIYEQIFATRKLPWLSNTSGYTTANACLKEILTSK